MTNFFLDNNILYNNTNHVTNFSSHDLLVFSGNLNNLFVCSNDVTFTLSILYITSPLRKPLLAINESNNNCVITISVVLLSSNGHCNY